MKKLRNSIDYIKKIPKNPASTGKFWKNYDGEYDKSKQIFINSVRKNYFESVVDQMRKKYIQDKDHLYTYGNSHLTLNFPMIDRERNENYISYINNKSKWIVNKDFDRYKQPEREKVYFPKILNEL